MTFYLMKKKCAILTNKTHRFLIAEYFWDQIILVLLAIHILAVAWGMPRK